MKDLKKNTKRKIIFSAKKVFAEKGFNGARMSSIAAAADVNQALLHYYFDSKEKLYESVFHRFIGEEPDRGALELTELIKSWNEGPGIELSAMIYLLVKFQIEYQDREINRLMAREFADDSEMIREIIMKYKVPRLENMAAIIKNGVEQGVFETSNPEMIVISLLSFIYSYSDGMELMEGTEVYERLFSYTPEFLSQFLIKQAFKALRPKDRELSIPELDDEKKKALNSIIADIAEKNSLTRI